MTTSVFDVTPECRVGESTVQWVGYAALFARLALGAAFLAAVADRFGLWGAPGQRNVAWGDFGHFVDYTAQVNSFLPAAVAPVLAWLATAAELVLGVALVVGVWPRIVAVAAGALLLAFALAMTLSFGIKQPLNYSVYSASAAAFLLVAVKEHVWTLDNLRRSLAARGTPPRRRE